MIKYSMTIEYDGFYYIRHNDIEICRCTIWANAVKILTLFVGEENISQMLIPSSPEAGLLNFH